MTHPTDDERLAALQEAARALPREMEPPPTLLGRVQAEIARKQVRPLSTEAHRTGAPSVAVRRWMLAAAALVLIVGTSAITFMLSNRGLPTDPFDGGPPIVTLPAGNTPARTTAMFATLDEYEVVARELSAAIATSRSKLRPETVAAVDRSLRTIDDAIAEARTALAKDPASGVVYELLLGMYRQKIDLLKRSAALAAS